MARELTDADLEKIVSTYHSWRAETGLTQRRKDAKESSEKEPLSASASWREHSDLPGFCKSATTAEIAAHGHVLTPGRYAGAAELEDDRDRSRKRMPRLLAELDAQFAESARLEKVIRANLSGLKIS